MSSVSPLFCCRKSLLEPEPERLQPRSTQRGAGGHRQGIARLTRKMSCGGATGTPSPALESDLPFPLARPPFGDCSLRPELLRPIPVDGPFKETAHEHAPQHSGIRRGKQKARCMWGKARESGSVDHNHSAGV